MIGLQQKPPPSTNQPTDAILTVSQAQRPKTDLCQASAKVSVVTLIKELQNLALIFPSVTA